MTRTEQTVGAGTVRLDVDGDVAVLTLANGAVNAISAELAADLGEAASRVAGMDVGALVVRSAVQGYFAVGADLKLFATLDEASFVTYLGALRRGFGGIAALPIPSIAAIDGTAVGGGLELALACTFRVARSGVRLGLPEVLLGMLPGAGGTQRLTRLIGPARALELLITGRQIDAEEAQVLGVVTRVTDSAEETARAWAAELAGGARDAIAGIVACVNAAVQLPIEEGLAFEERAARRLFETPDAQEGIRAFLEKRRPDFGGRE
jgi:enoyl-CoA hydratase